MFPKRVLAIAAALTALSSLASGYYHFVYFAGSAPFTPINLQFDLTKLTNNTVYFFIADQGPSVFVPGDSFAAEISELQLAANAWNSVSGSQIKLAYGGLENSATQQSAPGIDVVFSKDIPPGLLAQTLVTSAVPVSSISSTTPFMPIVRSQIQLQVNMTITAPQQASFYDSSFTTMVHEFGHALGLQHTLTSATMSTYITRSTTKSMPLAADDVAGITLLYPAPGYLATTGSISGQVTLATGGGVNLASVVAISPSTGIAISSLSNPDGTYEIDGIPPGSDYLVYVHPLPPAAQGEAGPDGIVLPQDPSQNYPANTGFVTQFFPDTRDWTQAVPVGVSAANIVPNVNFSVQSSAGPSIYGMEVAGSLNNVTEYNPMLIAGGSYYMEFLAPGYRHFQESAGFGIERQCAWQFCSRRGHSWIYAIQHTGLRPNGHVAVHGPSYHSGGARGVGPERPLCAARGVLCGHQRSSHDFQVDPGQLINTEMRRSRSPAPTCRPPRRLSSTLDSRQLSAARMPTDR